MIKFKELNSDSSPWLEDSCWPKAEPKVLGCDVDILAFLTCAVINTNRMNAICMKYSRYKGGEARRWAWGTIMTKLNALSKHLKGGLFKIVAIPLLENRIE